MDINKAKKALSIVKAIAYTENGGHPNLSKLQAGGSGEIKSIFQYMPETWKQYSKEVTGKDNVPLNSETEAGVTYKKVSDWLDNGYSPEQIFSKWNSGRPDAYKQGVKGVNSKGVKYDTPGYVKKAVNYLNSFEKEETKKPIQEGSVKPAMAKNENPGMIVSSKVTTNNQKGLISER